MSSYDFSMLGRLEGPQLIVRPITEADLEPLAYALVSPTTWFSVTRNLDTVTKFVEYYGDLLNRHKSGQSLTVVASHKISGEFVATSTYQMPGPHFSKIEIGFTWIADRWQRTFVNSELKLIMLAHAFKQMKVSRVEFSVHPDNIKSNAAMKRMGAVLEGTLRKWRKLSDQDDGNRNIYSVIDDEWPKVKTYLESQLTRIKID